MRSEEETKYIIISLEEYKELLIIKGKYEEFKSCQIKKAFITCNGATTPSYEPYKVTCSEGDSNDN